MANKRHYSSDKSDASRDSGMISKDSSSHANMPQEVVYKAWPKARGYSSYELNDTIKGIDSQVRDDEAGAKREKSGTKY